MTGPSVLLQFAANLRGEIQYQRFEHMSAHMLRDAIVDMASRVENFDAFVAELAQAAADTAKARAEYESREHVLASLYADWHWDKGRKLCELDLVDWFKQASVEQLEEVLKEQYHGGGYGDDFWIADEELDSNNQVPVSHREEGIFRQILGWLADTNRWPGSASFFEDMKYYATEGMTGVHWTLYVSEEGANQWLEKHRPALHQKYCVSD